MRAVVQRVNEAAVKIDGRIVSSIGQGILALIGIYRDDSEKDMEYIAEKILQVRIFPDDRNLMNLSLTDINGELLIVSQFTLYGDARKGRRPSYSEAMPPEKAAQFYNTFLDLCKTKYPKISSGVFGAMMDISLMNSGPVTILLDSTRLF
jgi:D-aminoacyl-tRNA deacylase